MSDDCELEVDYGVEEQHVIEDMAACLVETEFAAVEEEVTADDEEEEDDDEGEEVLLEEEVVANEALNGIEFEEEDEEVDDEEDDEEAPHQLMAASMTEEHDDNDSNELLTDANDDPEGCVAAGGGKVGENEVYQWSAFTGLRVKTFTADELVLFRRPFELGWKREVVLRGTVTSSGKKIGDVYYFSPDKKTKLRSYVEMGLHLKRSQCGLLPENFTFARQPIYRPPQEIVRHAMQRGGGQHQVQPSHIIDSSPFTPAHIEPPEPSVTSSGGQSPVGATAGSRSARNSTASESEEQFSMSIAEGRAKRKRVAPTRFEDEDYNESPLKKKGSHRERGPPFVGANGQQTSTPAIGAKSATGAPKAPPMGPKPQLSLQEKRRQLQHQLLQQVHEQTLKKAALEAPKTVVTTGETVSDSASEAKAEKQEKENAAKEQTPKGPPLSARKSIGGAAPVRPKDEPKEESKETDKEKTDNKADNPSDKSDVETGGASGQEQPVSGAPCSMHCPGRRGMLPNLMCSRCFCLYHLDCVPGGVFLEEPRVFVCPNCLKPEDTQKNTNSQQTNGHPMTNGTPDDADVEPGVPQLMPKTSLFVSTAPILIQQPAVKPRSTFAPILPKPPQLQNHQLYQQHLQKQRKQHFHHSVTANHSSQPLAPFNKSAAMNVKLPVGTHLYRVATGPNGHSMIVKDKSIKPKLKTTSANARKSIGSHSVTTSGHNGVSARHLSAADSLSMPYYKPAPIAPIGPMKYTPQELERQLKRFLHPNCDRKRRGYREHMEKRRAAVGALLSPYSSLNRVLSYLCVADLVRLRHVSRDWHSLCCQPFLWRSVRLKGICIQDWIYLAKNIVETNASLELDFDGVKASQNQDICDFWRNFSSIVDYIKSVRHLRFGSIPTFVLEEIVNAAVTDNPYNSFANLELLSVRNVWDEESGERDGCGLHFVSDFHTLKALKSLHLNAKNGFICDDTTVALLTAVFAAMSLESLVLTSLKDFASEQFAFLQSLRALKHLEIGSCSQWFQSPKTTDETEGEAVGEKRLLSGAFKYLSELTALRSLRLVDIAVDENAHQLPQMLESLLTLEALTVDNLRVEPSGLEVLEDLCAVLRALPLRSFTISTSDALTNKCCFDLLKKLDNCSHLRWKVVAVVEDSGECFVPFRRDDDSEADGETAAAAGETAAAAGDSHDVADVKFMDLTFLNEVIQSELSHALIEITPQ